MLNQDGMAGATDVLSPLARNILKINADNAYQKLVVADGDGNPDAKAIMEGLAPSQLLSAPVGRPENAAAMMAGLWLWHDWLDESHVISQALGSATGSFWHAIMHRREGDFSNSKYWYARTAGHPIYTALAAHALTVINPLPADKQLLRVVREGWDADAFVDLVERVSGRDGEPRLRTVQALQQMEWRLLFEHCAREAGGR